MKKCTACQETKPLDQFYKLARARDGLMYNCKACMNVRAANWYKSNPDVRREVNARYEVKRKAARARTKAEQAPKINVAAVWTPGFWGMS